MTQKKSAHWVPGSFNLKSKNEPGEPSFEFWRDNHDYTGESFQEKVKRRLKGLQKELKGRGQKNEADDIGRMVENIAKKASEEILDFEPFEEETIDEPTEVVTKEEALDPKIDFHLKWLSDGEHERRRGHGDQTEWRDFVRKNLTTLNNIVGTSKIPKYLGSGNEGDAWELSTGKVVKIFTDIMGDYGSRRYKESSATVFDQGGFGETETMIYGSGDFIETKNHINLKWVILEKFNTMKDWFDKTMAISQNDPSVFETYKDITLILHKLINVINSEVKKGSRYMVGEYPNREYLDDKGISLHQKDVLNIYESLKGHIQLSIKSHQKDKTLLGSLDIVKDNLNLADDWVDKLIMQILIKRLMGRNDFGLYNMGIRPSTGQLIFFDA